MASLALLAGAGCTQTTTTNLNANNSNDVVVDVAPANTNETMVENTNAVLENENTNVADNNTNEIGDATVDTSDWLTYENVDMGVRFNYPAEWILDEYYSGYAWQKYGKGSAWVRFIAPNGEKIVISRGRNETIKVETNQPSEIKYTNITYTSIHGYNSAEVKSINEFVSNETRIATWIEIDNDLIRMPDINEFPELEQVIASFEIINE